MSVTTIDLSSDAQVNIICKRGDTFQMDDLRFWQDEAKTIAQDITGYDFIMKVVDSEGVEILSFVTPTNFTIHDTNYLTISMSAAGMAVDASPEGQPYSYDLQMTDTDDKVTTIMKGDLTIKQDIS